MNPNFFQDFRNENGFDFVEAMDMFMPTSHITCELSNLSNGLDLIKKYIDGDGIKISEVFEIINTLEQDVKTLSEYQTKCTYLWMFRNVRRYFDQHTMATDFGEISMKENKLCINGFTIEYDESKHPIENINDLIRGYKDTL
jgi:hypothetical protein